MKGTSARAANIGPGDADPAQICRWPEVLGPIDPNIAKYGSNHLDQHRGARRRVGKAGCSGQTVCWPRSGNGGWWNWSNVCSRRTALNLVHAFAIALKHHLRFEPDIAYKDLVGLVGHLDTFAKEASDPDLMKPHHKTPWKVTGEYLGVSFAESNPRKRVKRAKKPLGHLPIEILNHLSAYIDHCVKQGIFPSALHQGQLSKEQVRD